MNECPYLKKAKENNSFAEMINEESVNYNLKSYYERMDNPKKNFTTNEALWIAQYLNVKFDKFDIEQFRIGLDVELEHGKINTWTNITNDDSILTGKITLAHLNEFPDYYKRLTKMEEDAESYWEHKE